jgi:hypothetical protein
VEPPVLQKSTLFILLHVTQHTDVRGEKMVTRFTNNKTVETSNIPQTGK